MQINIDLVKKRCEEHEAFFLDLDFKPDASSLFKNPDKVPKYHSEYPADKIVWKRPHELMPGSKMVQLKTGSFKNLEPGDIQQGILGDCYFLGSLMIMASTNWKLVQNLIVFDGVQKYGFAVF